MTKVKPDLTSNICVNGVYSVIDKIKEDVADVLKSDAIEDEKAVEILLNAGKVIDDLLKISFKIEELYGER